MNAISVLAHLCPENFFRALLATPEPRAPRPKSLVLFQRPAHLRERLVDWITFLYTRKVHQHDPLRAIHFVRKFLDGTTSEIIVKGVDRYLTTGFLLYLILCLMCNGSRELEIQLNDCLPGSEFHPVANYLLVQHSVSLTVLKDQVRIFTKLWQKESTQLINIGNVLFLDELWMFYKGIWDHMVTSEDLMLYGQEMTRIPSSLCVIPMFLQLRLLFLSYFPWAIQEPIIGYLEKYYSPFIRMHMFVQRHPPPIPFYLWMKLTHEIFPVSYTESVEITDKRFMTFFDLLYAANSATLYYRKKKGVTVTSHIRKYLGIERSPPTPALQKDLVKQYLSLLLQERELIWIHQKWDRSLPMLRRLFYLYDEYDTNRLCPDPLFVLELLFNLHDRSIVIRRDPWEGSGLHE